MKNLKTLLVAALMVCSVVAMAQDQPQGQRSQRQGQGQSQGQGQGQRQGRQQMTVKDRAEREAAQIHQAVELSDKQISQVYKVTYKYALQDSLRMVEMRAQREQGQQGQQIDREAMMKQREEITTAKTKEINAVLTPEQQAKYKKMQEQQNANRRQGQNGQGGRPEGGSDRGFGGGAQGGGPGGDF